MEVPQTHTNDFVCFGINTFVGVLQIGFVPVVESMLGVTFSEFAVVDIPGEQDLCHELAIEGSEVHIVNRLDVGDTCWQHHITHDAAILVYLALTVLCLFEDA